MEQEVTGTSNIYFEGDSYILKRTIELDEFYNSVNQSRIDNSSINRNKKSAWNLVAQVPAEELMHNKTLKDMLWLQEVGQPALAKRKLREYLRDNTRAKISNV